ncbi:MAG TPA: response regulator [Spirochaetota bacterium]|nr:response regulator [Spirochaetota bacterium]
MKSARTILIITETLTALLMVFFIIFILYFLQMHIKSGYINLQKQDISKVEMIIKTFIEKKHSNFNEILKTDNKPEAKGLINSFSDLYYLDKNLKVTSILTKKEGSIIFPGYDFSTSKPALFFRTVKSSTPVNSGMFISPETDTPGFYIASAEGNGYIVGRVDIEQLKDTLKWFGEFSSNILLLATSDGYVLSKTSDAISLQILPAGDFTEIELNENYMMSKGRSEAVDCDIAVFTPLSSVYSLVDSMKIYYLLFIVMIITVIFLKTLIAVKFFIKPVESFSSIISGWIPGNVIQPLKGFFYNIKEISMLFETFRDKSDQITSGINELRQKENEVQGIKNYLKSIIDSMPSIIISADRDGMITEWNTAASRFTGVEADKAIGSDLFLTFPELEVIEWYYNETRRTGRGYEVKKGISRDGVVTDMNISIFTLSATGYEGIVVRLDDITLFEKAESSLRQAQKMEVIGTLAGGLAHDFNNILAGIQGSVSILRLKTEGSDDLNRLRPVYEKYFGYLEQSAERSADIIARLLTISRKHESVRLKVDLNEVVSIVEGICRSSFDKSVDISVKLSDEEALIKGDNTQLEQAILNLCVNGAHSMTIMRGEDEHKGGPLSITMGRTQPDEYFLKTHPESSPEYDYWSISIKDSGVGMTREVLAGMFDPFFTTKGKKGGTGLGLTMVYNIIQQHGGFIDVYTEKGKGSEFIIYLPVLKDDFAPESADTSGAIRKGEGTILVVDDEEVIRKVSQELLSMCGFKVITAEDGYAGVRVFRERAEEIKLVLLDVIMPGMSGLETYRELRAVKNDVKVLLTSGFRNEEKIQEGVEQGINGFIQKPFTLNRLSEAVFKIIES